MEGKRFLRSIRLQNILSFGPDTPELTLEPLNVLIGPNASGKSNLIEALTLLAATPRDLQAPLREGGGVHEWLWKGVQQLGIAKIDVTVDHHAPKHPLRYQLSFRELPRHVFYLDSEVVNSPGLEEASESLYYIYIQGNSVISTQTQSDESGQVDSSQGSSTESAPRFDRKLKREDVVHDQSILSQRNDPFSYPELTYLRSSFQSIGFLPRMESLTTCFTSATAES